MAACNSVSHTITPVISGCAGFDEVQAISFTERVGEFASNLFAASSDFIYEHPIISGVVVVGSICVLGGLLFYSLKETPLPQLNPTIIEATTLLHRDGEEDFDSAQVLVGKYVDDLCKATKFKEGLCKEAINPAFKKYLSDKILSVCVRRMSPEVKKTIIENLTADAKELLMTAEKRAKADLAGGRLDRLGINRGATIREIIPLGDESHYEGKIPLKITFSDGKSIVYKPRSMLPEQVLFDSAEGLFKEVGFGTYAVVCNTDEGGHYGYADFIENRVDIEENTVKTPEDLHRYVEKLCVLDQIGEILGLSDFHNKNIMTQGLDPKVIDAEVYLTPPGVETGMWDNCFGHGAGVIFDAGTGTDKKYEGTNRIGFDSSFPKRNLFKYTMTEENLRKVGIDRSEIQSGCVISKKVGSAIEAAKEKLQTLPGRFVLIDTKALNDQMRSLDPTDSDSVEDLVKLIRHSVSDFKGIEFAEDSVGAIRDQIKKDALHNDVPAFCHDSTRQEILYNGIVIGKHQE